MNLPVTRYYGSKRKVVGNIWSTLNDANVHFDSFLDLFGGTGIVSYYVLAMGKQVCYNDLFAFNCENAKALLATPKNSFNDDDALTLLQRDPLVNYNDIIERNFRGIYYLDSENRTIDTVVQNISRIEENKKHCGYYILNQSCLIKRPFNLFHRRNLNLRLNHNNSSFGNYVTWEKSFKDLFLQFTKELNTFQFDDVPDIRISNRDALDCDTGYDLVYVDPPYLSKGTPISYHSRYHFLEGLMHYDEIERHMNYNKSNLELDFNNNSEFEHKKSFIDNLRELFSRYQNSIIALSYTSNGYPSIEELANIMKDYKAYVDVFTLGKKSFALNKNNAGREEILIVGR